MRKTQPHIAAMRFAEPMTVEDLVRLDLPNHRTELVRGRLIVKEPAGFRHGTIAARLARFIGNHVDEHSLGIVLAAETGFTLARQPDTVRAPDVAFVSRERVPDPMPIGFANFAPDIAVEVVSPSDRREDVDTKVADWINAGTKLVWVVHPDRRVVQTYSADGSEVTVPEDGVLEGLNVLPGFSCGVAAILDAPRPR